VGASRLRVKCFGDLIAYEKEVDIDNKLNNLLKITDIIKVFFPTDVKLDSSKNNIKFALKLTLKSSYMFRCKTPSSGSIPSEPC